MSRTQFAFALILSSLVAVPVCKAGTGLTDSTRPLDTGLWTSERDGGQTNRAPADATSFEEKSGLPLPDAEQQNHAAAARASEWQLSRVGEFVAGGSQKRSGPSILIFAVAIVGGIVLGGAILTGRER